MADNTYTRDAESLENFNPQSTLAVTGATAQVNETSYLTILNDLHRFRASAMNNDDYYDFPGHTFFKILFHFNNGTDASVTGTPGTQFNKSSDLRWDAMSGLLAPSWAFWNTDFNEAFELAKQDILNVYQHSTAWNYFVMNNDEYRARCVASFITLLSNISSKTPWYFTKVGGLDSAIKRDIVTFGQDQQFSIKSEKQKIQIDCLEDSYDQRIGTLLDLYRSFVWSWETKREMLPVNLRKFDMTIIQFQMPLRGTHTGNNAPTFNSKNTDYFRGSKIVYNVKNDTSKEGGRIEPEGFAVIYPDGDKKLASFKAWEFHGCEIDYNSSSNNIEMDNENGNEGTKHRIEIAFDDMMEIRYNEFFGDKGMYVSDMYDDLNQTSSSDAGGDSWIEINDESEKFKNMSPAEYQAARSKGPLTGLNKNLDGGGAHGNVGGNNIISQLLSPYKNKLQTKLNKVLIGNINGLSVQRVVREMQQAASGNVWATINNIKNYKKDRSRNIYNINSQGGVEMTDTSVVGEGNFNGHSNEFTRDNIFYDQLEAARANTLTNS